MNEPQRTAQPEKEVPPPQEPAGDDDGMQAGSSAAAPAPDLDDPDDHAQDNDATDSPNT
ncbi:MAG: hypothetical protein M3486_05345 [Actinomycetota bacterium]|nr:hypothetical protein [Actinomycetota bacterium]